MSTFQDIKYKYNSLNAFGKIIAITTVIFIINILFNAFKIGGIFNYFRLPSDFWDFLLQPWSIITYGFLHNGIFHILFNMLMLYYLSNVAANIFKEKLVLNVFFLGIITGGLLFLGVVNLWPTNYFVSPGIVGASAGVAALLAFVPTYLPDSAIRLFGAFNIKWMHIAIFFVVFDIIRLFSGQNQGGYVSHLGGYILGFYYASQLKRGTDIGLGFGWLMDRFVNLFKPKSTLKTVHRKSPRSTTTKRTKSHSETSSKQKRIDNILDKISKSGYESLSAEEKEFLFKAGKE